MIEHANIHAGTAMPGKTMAVELIGVEKLLTS
jgi:hypothetical protein